PGAGTGWAQQLGSFAHFDIRQKRSTPHAEHETKRGGPIGPPLVWCEGTFSHPYVTRRPTGHDRMFDRVYHTNRSLFPSLGCARVEIVAHSLTPKIAQLSPKPSTPAV